VPCKNPSDSAAFSIPFLPDFLSSESNGIVPRRPRSGAVVRRARRRRLERWRRGQVDAGAGHGEPRAGAVDDPVGRGGGGGARGAAAGAPHPGGGAPPPGRRRLPQAPHRLRVRLRGACSTLSLPPTRCGYLSVVDRPPRRARRVRFFWGGGKKRFFFPGDEKAFSFLFVWCRGVRRLPFRTWSLGNPSRRVRALLPITFTWG
jgi:hypothetical protein